MARIDDDNGPSARIEGDQPTAQPSTLPSADPVRPAFDVLFPNLNRVSGATFRRGTLSRRRVNRALGMLLAIAVLTTLIVVFGDFISARLGTFLSSAFVVIVTIGLLLLLRDGQRERRAAQDSDE